MPALFKERGGSKKRIVRKRIKFLSCPANDDNRERDEAVVTVQKILGLNLLLQDRYTEAEPVAREALALMEKLVPDDWSRFHALSMVGGSGSTQASGGYAPRRCRT